jgi:glycosyltransferase involved in cell wall biosynthesis
MSQLLKKRSASVCMATYNGEKYIKDQLETILSQLGEQDELIISDDSSTDSTLDIITAFQDPRIRIIKNQLFKSPIYNFENALKHATGDFLFLSDQDDIWLPSKLETMKKYLSMYDLVVCDCSYVDDDMSLILESYFEWRNAGPGLLKNLYKNRYLGCCMAFNRKVLNLSLPFPKDIPMHDIWIGIVGDMYCTSFFLKEKLMLYRRHSNNVTVFSDRFTSPFSYLEQFKFRFKIVKNLLKLYFTQK